MFVSIFLSPTNRIPKIPEDEVSPIVEIHETVPIHSGSVPSGSRFKGYQEFIVQDLIIGNWNTCYRRGRWQTISYDYGVGQLPEDISGSHFGSTLRAFILYQHYGCHVTQAIIKEQLQEMGVSISTGQINNIIINDKDRIECKNKYPPLDEIVKHQMTCTSV